MEQQNQNEKNILYREGMSLKNAGYILAPMLIYYLVHDLIKYLLMYLVVQSANASECMDQLTKVQGEVSAIVGGITMVIACLIISPFFKKDKGAAERNGEEVKIAKGDFASFDGKTKVLLFGLLILQAGFLAMGLNLLMELSGFTRLSAVAQKTSEVQYSVIWPIGIILYGIISPFAEEFLFRGILQYRLRKLFIAPLAIFLSSFFFGLYHANLVQGVYGLAMGLILGILYEKTGKLLFPVCYHASANLFVFLAGTFWTMEPAYQWPNCMLFLLLAGGITMIIAWAINKPRQCSTNH